MSNEQRLVPAVVTLAEHSHGPAIVVRLPDGIEVELRGIAKVDAAEIGRMVAQLRRAGA